MESVENLLNLVAYLTRKLKEMEDEKETYRRMFGDQISECTKLRKRLEELDADT